MIIGSIVPDKAKNTELSKRRKKMKQLTCELCGSNDLVKQDGFFACQHCGTKYSIEEARKMIVEVDNSKKMTNLYERARKSIEVNDLSHAAEYYKEILDETPDDWEAYFYAYLGEFTSFTNAQAGSVAAKLANTIPCAYDMATKDGEASEIEERIKIITEKTADRLVGIARSAESMLRQHEGGMPLSPAGKVKSDMYQRMRQVAASTISNCVVAFDPLESKLQELINGNSLINKAVVNECLLLVRKTRYNVATWTFSPTSFNKERLIREDLISLYAEKIKELDPTFIVEDTTTANKKQGCYVATCVYGSYDCPQVWTLRRYRDNTLGATWYGRAFIRIYYAVSPTLVKWFGKTNWFKKMWRGKLDRMVKELQSKGVEDTPYDDKKW